jgi:hypothetical protein
MALDDDSLRQSRVSDGIDYILDIREYDVPYVVRVCIDCGKQTSTLLSIHQYAKITASAFGTIFGTIKVF